VAIDALGPSGQECDILKVIESGQIALWVLDGESGIAGPDTATGSGRPPATPTATPSTTTTPGGRGGR
jgi:hypothetical protein